MRPACFTGPASLLLTPFVLLWGFFVVADSAQFSAMVAEAAPPHAVGTALTLQTSLGFLLTMATIQLVPVLVDAVGWRLAFVVLALGPAAGIAAIRRLDRLQPTPAGLGRTLDALHEPAGSCKQLLAYFRWHPLYSPPMTVRDELLGAAARVYAEAGYRGATTRRIALAAGVNEITLFRHFGSKDALLREALARCQDPHSDELLPETPSQSAG